MEMVRLARVIAHGGLCECQACCSKSVANVLSLYALCRHLPPEVKQVDSPFRTGWQCFGQLELVDKTGLTYVHSLEVAGKPKQMNST
jgi:hypothetical protein